MKKSALLLITLFTFISCESIKIEDEIADIDQTPIIQALLQGNYDQCIPSVLYGGYYAQYSVSIVGDKITTSRKLDNNSDCSSPYYTLTEEMKLVRAEFTDSSETAIDIDVSMIKYKEAYNDSWYISRDYCGMTDWVLGVEKELTGLSCPTLLAYDSFHTSFKSVGDMSYLRFNVSPTTISYPVGFEQSGDGANTRKTTKLATILKI